MGSNGASDDVVGVTHVGDPITHGLKGSGNRGGGGQVIGGRDEGGHVIGVM